ncbi:mannose-6-phosphate isomerase, class I [Priestia aryabhattai]|uniref:mannose-6-phosphate isomerase, class I n=2 Tax=Bacillaceae TaxID=186817 RepID=UPI001C8D022E|nr:mannose-6-phosphate isomerase, class I [Priestia aryabhattai]
MFQERIWGGRKLEEEYNYLIPSSLTGECWAISAHPHGQSIIKRGKYQQLTLSQLWSKHRHLFGHLKNNQFPLLTKIIDANDDLSIQVHPNDDYANKYENGELGKTECWYIIDCEKDAEIIIGHHAQTKQEFVEKVKNRQWSQLLRRIKIKPGDFFHIPSGVLHAICKGTLLLETQQNSDTTYRVYDYDRLNENGSLRKLHMEKAIDVITIPHVDTDVEPIITKTGAANIITFIQCDYFTLYKWDIFNQLKVKQDQPFMLASVIKGKGSIKMAEQEYVIRKGDHFILPYKIEDFIIVGNVQLIVSHPSVNPNP